MRVVDKAFLAACMVVGGSTAVLPFVRGYGTRLFQLLVFGAWAIIAKLSSEMFADQHHGPVWVVAFVLNMLCFGFVAVPLWLMSRKRVPRPARILIICWTVFYLAMLFILFPRGGTLGPD